MPYLRIIIAILSTATILFVSGCEGDEGSAPVVYTLTPDGFGMVQGSDRVAAYAGSESCRECHEEAFDAWKNSHHARALRGMDEPLDRVAYEPPKVIHHGTQVSRAEVQDGKLILETMGPDGKPVRYEPKGVIGVAPLWQYLVTFPRGRLQVTELAWDPEEKEWFNVYGDEDRQHWEWGHWSQRGMNWNSMCATCHTTAYQKNYEPQRDGYSSTWLEMGVGCEQCHGPMKDHVQWQHKHRNKAGDPTIKAMDRRRHMNVCASCHARRGDLTGEFMPGDWFVEHYELVLPDLTDTYYPDGQVREEDFEYAAFTQSYMHEWGVTCLDCHLPHEAKPRRTDNQLCQRCHETGISNKRPIDEAEHSRHPVGKPGFHCVDCHMPQTVYMARHWRRDHGMTIPDPLLTREFGIPNACTRCHETEGVDWAIQYTEEWYGDRMNRPTRDRARLLARLKQGDLDAAPGVIDLLGGETNAHWRAIYLKFLVAVIEAAQTREQLDPVVEAIIRALSDDSPLVQAVAIEALEPLGRGVVPLIPEKLNSLHRLVRIKAAWVLRDSVDLESQAGRDLMKYLQQNQDQPLGAMQWAMFHESRGALEPALTWYARSLAWDSRLVPARHRYGTLLNEVGRTDDAIELFLEGASIEPENALYPYWLGLLYSELGKMEAARDALAEAVARDDQQARFWYNLALAEYRLNRAEAAFEALGRAEKLDPGQPHYPYTRATILLQLEQRDKARQALERALDIDPNHAPSRELLSKF